MNASSLKRIDGVVKNAVPHQGLEGFAVHYVGGIAEEFGDVKPEPRVLNSPMRRFRWRSTSASMWLSSRASPPGNGTEDGGMTDAQSPQFGLMLAHRLEKAMNHRLHCCYESGKFRSYGAYSPSLQCPRPAAGAVGVEEHFHRLIHCHRSRGARSLSEIDFVQVESSTYGRYASKNLRKLLILRRADPISDRLPG